MVDVAPIALRLMGVFPQNGTGLLFRIMLTLGFFETVLFLIYDACWRSMTFDITEQAELETGRRNEGVISSAITFASKIAYAVGSLLAGMMLALIAFPTETGVDQVSRDVIFDLGVIYGPVVPAIWFGALFGIKKYELSRSEHENTSSRLVER